MPPTSDDLSDDTVALLLSQDAAQRSKQYATLGLKAFLPTRAQPSNAPKPNKRFLKNIIRDTTAHNATLLRQEARESRGRLKALERKDRFGDEDENEGRERKRRRKEGQGSRERGDGHHRRSSCRERDRERSRDKDRRRRHNRHRDEDNKERESRRRHRARTEDDHHHDRSRSDRHHYRRRKEDANDDDTDRSRSRSPTRSNRSRQHRDHRSRRHRSRSRSRSRSQSNPPAAPQAKSKPSRSPSPSSSDSDPLESLIGPPIPSTNSAPTHRKGRGRFSGPASLSARFNADYDPLLDTNPSADDDDDDGDRRVPLQREQGGGEDDWGAALRAVREKRAWKIDQGRRGAEPVDTMVEGKGNEEEVKWAKAGEGREWDRGKVLDHNNDDDGGIVRLKPSWA